MTAHDGGYRIVIVDPADDMNANAANALLKSLEEPPANCLFFLMAHSPGRLLPTIRSRCRILRLRQLEDDDLLRALKAINVELPGDDTQRRLLLDQAGGSVRDALVLIRFAGLDIVSELQKVVATPRFDVAAGLQGRRQRGGARRWRALRRLQRCNLGPDFGAGTNGAAGDGQLARAAELSSFWQEATERIGATRVYNLDRRQHVVGLFAPVAWHGTLRRTPVWPSRARWAIRAPTLSTPDLHANDARPILHHYPDLLPERQAAYRPCLHGDRHGCAGSLPAARRQGRGSSCPVPTSTG